MWQKKLLIWFHLQFLILIITAKSQKTLKLSLFGKRILLKGFSACESADKIIGFQAGADDYIMKPFDLDELGARVAAHLRREQRRRDKAAIRLFGELAIDYSAVKRNSSQFRPDFSNMFHDGAAAALAIQPPYCFINPLPVKYLPGM